MARMSEGDHQHDRTPEQDLAIAAEAMERDDLGHAAFHVARAIAAEPLAESGLALLARLAGCGKTPAELFPLQRDASYGVAAARAWLEHRLGEHDHAMNLLCQVIGVRPDLPFVRWLASWISDEQLVAGLDPTRLAGTLSHAIEGAREAAPAIARVACGELADVTATIRRQHADVPHLAGLHGRALRRAGRTAEAVTVAEDEDARAPSYMTAVYLGASRRDHGDLDGARDAYRHARQRDRSDAAILLDIGDVSLDLRDYPAAIAAYQEAIAQGEGEHWAPASLAYCRWLVDGDDAHRQVLEQRADSGEARARELLHSVRPYERWLPEPVEAVMAIVRQIASGSLTSAPVDLAISSFEAPSAIFEMAAFCERRFGVAPALSMNIPSPDPRRPRVAGAAALWRFQPDHRPVPAISPPADEIAERMRRLASRPYRRADWFDAAGELVRDLDARAVPELAAAMVHPPPAPDGTPPWDWRRDVQVAAALALAWLPGDGDAVIDRLRWYVDGQVDWTCTAALVALTEVASRSSARVDAVAALFEHAYAAPLSPVVYMCLLKPVAHLALQLPDRSPEFVTRWRTRRAELAD